MVHFIGLEKVTNIFLPVSIGLSALDWHSETQMVLCYCILMRFSSKFALFYKILMFYHIMFGTEWNIIIVLTLFILMDFRINRYNKHGFIHFVT